MIEVWKPLPKYNNCYEVSNLGRVRSIKRLVKGSRGSLQIKPSVVLTPRTKANGYQSVHIRLDGTNSYPLVHRLVATVFLPNDNNLPQVNHKDGNKLNNRVENLEWCSASQNMKHAFELGLAPSGGRSHLAKLSFGEVLAIKSEYVRGSKDFGIVALARKYGISKSMISLIVREEKWKYQQI